MAGINRNPAGYDVITVKDSSDVDLTSVTKTATFNSAKIEIPEISYIGVFVKTAAQGGTSPTLDVKLQASFDGTDWADLEDAESPISGQAIALDQIGAANTVKYMQCRFGGAYLRLVFTIAGTSPTYDITARVVAKNSM